MIACSFGPEEERSNDDRDIRIGGCACRAIRCEIAAEPVMARHCWLGFHCQENFLRLFFNALRSFETNEWE